MIICLFVWNVRLLELKWLIIGVDVFMIEKENKLVYNGKKKVNI